MCLPYANATSHPLRTPTGVVVPCLRLRDLRRGEVDVVRAVFDGLSPDSRFRRFHAPTPRLSASTAAYLAEVDGVDHVAIVAETPGDIPVAVGIGRYVRTEADTAEIALAVVDAWQHRGVGRRLLRGLQERAVGAGISGFVGTTHADNGGILRLVSELGVRMWDVEGGAVTFTADIRPTSGLSAAPSSRRRDHAVLGKGHRPSLWQTA